MRYKAIFVGIFFGLFLSLGLFVYRDYGIGWDEPLQRKLGINTYEYITGKNEQLLKNKDKVYGSIFETFTYGLEQAFGIDNLAKVYYLRHLVIFFTFFIAVFFFYLIIYERFKSVFLALTGSLVLILSPRIFAHSFYNSKDLVFLSVFIIASYFCIRLIKYAELKWMVLAALFTGILIDVRIAGIVLIGVTAVVSFFKIRDYRYWLGYIFLTAGFVVLFWPFLWSSPVENFLESYKFMSTFPQTTSTTYFGKEVSSLKVPWHYTLGWIAVTTPIFYLVLGALGLSKNSRNYIDWFLLLWLLLPLLLVIITDPGLYDAWRQMFFIYPAIVYFSVLGLKSLPKALKVPAWFLLALTFAITVNKMILLHPYQNIYFNNFTRSKFVPIEKYFSLDYWGLSYRQGLQKILEVDDRNKIKVAAENFPGEIAVLFFGERFEVVPRGLEDYYLTNFRSEKGLYYKEPYLEVSIDGIKLLGVFKIQHRL